MPIISANACAKLILAGEHAVVYGQPALAVPLQNLRIRAVVEPSILAPSGDIYISIPQLSIDSFYTKMPAGYLVARIIETLLDHLKITQIPSCSLRVRSEIPFGSGLGSSAALAIAIFRGLSGFLGHPLSDEDLNHLAFLSEQSAHGNPSGIDNTVISYEKPIYFIRDQRTEFLNPGAFFTLVVADSGVHKSTAQAVSQLSLQRENDPERINYHLNEIGGIVKSARSAFINGNKEELGELINQNQEHLSALNLSSLELDKLINAARNQGAYGAKLSGGGLGGHMLALVDQDAAEDLKTVLLQSGATAAYIAYLSPVNL